MNRPVCEETVVGACDYGQVHHCADCQTYHVHLGALSLRLQGDVFLELAAMMGRIHEAQAAKDETPRLRVVPAAQPVSQPA